MIFNFEELLVISAIAIFAFVFFLLVKNKISLNVAEVKKSQISPSIFSKVLYPVHIFLILLFVGITAYSAWFGSRPFIYYVIFAAIFLTSVLMVLTSPSKQKSLVARTVIFSVILLTLAQCMLPIIENRFIIIGADQWGDIVLSKTIVAQGNFLNSNAIAAAVPATGYYSIPLFNVLLASISLFVGSSLLPFTILTCLIGLVTVLSIYLILLKLTKTHIAPLVGALVFLSTPQLASVQVLPSTVSLTLGFVLVLLLINHLTVPRRGTLVVILLVSLCTIIFHPVGILVLFLICSGLIITSRIGLFRQHFLRLKLTQSLLVICGVLMLAYYFFANQAIFSSIIVPTRKLNIKYIDRFSFSGAGGLCPKIFPRRVCTRCL